MNVYPILRTVVAVALAAACFEMSAFGAKPAAKAQEQTERENRSDVAAPAAVGVLGEYVPTNPTAGKAAPLRERDDNGRAGGGAKESQARGGTAEKSIGIEPQPLPPDDRRWPGRRIFWVEVDPDQSAYTIGDPVRIRFRASDDCYVYIFNTDARGTVRQIFPNFYDRDNSVRGGSSYWIPDRGYSLVAGGPPGRESLQIMAYRQRYASLEPWRRFDRSQPFPVPRFSPKEMQGRVESEAKRSSEGQKRSSPGRDGARAMEIRPMPPRPYDYYAEDWAYLTVREPYYRYDDWDGPPQPRYEGNSTPPSSERSGKLNVSTTPSGAEIFVDGVYRGRTPATIAVREGRREVTLVLPGERDMVRRDHGQAGKDREAFDRTWQEIECVSETLAGFHYPQMAGRDGDRM